MLIVNVVGSVGIHGSHRLEHNVGGIKTIYITAQYVAEVRHWACGLQIDQLNIMVEISHEDTLYLLSRVRQRQAPLIHACHNESIVCDKAGKSPEDRFSGECLRRWIEDSYVD